MSDIQSQLAKYCGRQATSDAQLRSMAAAAWHEHGILLISPSQLQNNIDQSMRDTLGKRLYGERKGQ